MGLLATLTKVASGVTAVGVIGGGVVTLDTRHELRTEAEKEHTELRAQSSSIQADMRVDRIFKMVSEARDTGAPDWLCSAMDEEFVNLCTEMPGHYLCKPESKRELKAKAGCE